MDIYEYMSMGELEKPLDRIVTDGGFCSIFRTMACIGDSLSSGEFESVKENGGKRYHDFYEYSWGQFIGRSCGSKVYNFSRGGMTAKCFLESFSEECNAWKKENACQAYIIALGVNDVVNQNMEIGSVEDICLKGETKNVQTFAGYYSGIIQAIRNLQPRAKIFLVTIPKYNDEKDQRRKRVRDLLEDFTKTFNATYLIDLFTYAPVYNEKFRENFFLGHMTPTGYVLTARMIESYIDYLIRKNPKEFNQVGFIGTDLYYQSEK